MRPEFEDTIEKIKTLDTEMESTASTSVNDDAVSQVLGKDKPGRIRGMGRGITATKIAFMQARDSHVLKLEAKQAELQDELRGLKDVVRGLTASKSNHVDGVSNSEFSDLSKGPRCQILDWCSVDDVVIGEGEFCSSEPTYKIGRIPLGMHAGAILVKSVTNEEAPIWRPTTSVTTLGQAIGMKIAWQLEKLILDEDYSENMPTEGEGDKILIYDWSKEDVLVAEGRLQSTDPKKLVNNIPLGPSAAIVKVDRVVNEDGSLWRPNVEKLMIGDALGENIPWPIHKILKATVQANRDELMSRSRSRASASNSSNTSKNEKKKCILLDCKGSGKKVAEGRVSSTNPDDVVHFVRLGPNASKIWVDVPLIEDAPLWRPNSELQIIADAQGSIVAWPNDKLLYI